MNKILLDTKWYKHRADRCLMRSWLEGIVCSEQPKQLICEIIDSLLVFKKRFFYILADGIARSKSRYWNTWPSLRCEPISKPNISSTSRYWKFKRKEAKLSYLRRVKQQIFQLFNGYTKYFADISLMCVYPSRHYKTKSSRKYPRLLLKRVSSSWNLIWRGQREMAEAKVGQTNNSKIIITNLNLFTGSTTLLRFSTNTGYYSY